MADLAAPPKARPGARLYKAGDRFGELTFVEYAASTSSGSRAVFDCRCGYRVELALRNVSNGATSHCSDREHHADRRFSGQAITAGGRHQQLAIRHGSARTRPCTFCDEVTSGNE